MNNMDFNIRRLPIIYGVLLVISLIVMGCYWHVVSKVLSEVLGNLTLWIIYIVGIVGFVVLRLKYPQKFTTKEMLLSIGATFPAFFILVAVFFSSTTDLADKEFLNSNIVSIRWIEEYWTETEHCKTCKDKKGNSFSCDCHMVCDERHPDAYSMQDNMGNSFSIDREEYERIRARFSTPATHVASSQPGQCSGSGDEWVVKWTGSWETMVPSSVTHQYINYVKATNTINKLTGIKGNKDLILPYPTLQNKGYGDIDVDRVLTAGVKLPQAFVDSVDILTDRHLATLGKERQCNILYYFVNDTRSFTGYLSQEWVKGKKNDIVVIVGMKNWPNVEWAQVMCWSKQSLFCIQLRDQLQEMKQLSTATNLVNTVVTQIRKDPNDGGYERQPMEEYRYLLKEVHLGWFKWISIILLLALMVAPLIVYFFGTDDLE